MDAFRFFKAPPVTLMGITAKHFLFDAQQKILSAETQEYSSCIDFTKINSRDYERIYTDIKNKHQHYNALITLKESVAIQIAIYGLLNGHFINEKLTALIQFKNFLQHHELFNFNVTTAHPTFG